MLTTGTQLGSMIQAQSLAQVESNLKEHKSSIEKIADALGSGFAHVDDDLDDIRRKVNLVRVDTNSLDLSMKSILEHLEDLEEQGIAKDELITDLSCQVTKLSKALAQCPCMEDALKILSGLGSKGDPFKLEGADGESGGEDPQGSSVMIFTVHSSFFTKSKAPTFFSFKP